MGQFVPDITATFVDSDNVSVVQDVNGRIGQAFCLVFTSVDQPACAGRRNQGLIEPSPEAVLANVSLLNNLFQGVFVEADQGLVNVAKRLHIVGFNSRAVGGDLGPELVADNLEVDGLDNSPQGELGSRGSLPGPAQLNAAQVVNEVFRYALGEGPAGSVGGLLDRLQGGVTLQPFHAEAMAQVARQQVGVGGQFGDVVLAHSEQQVQVGVTGHGLIDLSEKALSVFPALGISGEQLLKLVKDEQGGVGLDQLKKPGFSLT